MGGVNLFVKSFFKFRWWKLLVLIVVIAVGLVAVLINPYDPDAKALEAMKSNSSVEVLNTKNWIQFTPQQTKKGPSIIFYPGGLVEPESYATLAGKLAESGHPTYIVKMPLDLAVLGGDRGNLLLEEFPDTAFVIGGHSLGGVMASRFAQAHQDRIKGIFFLASYPDAKGSINSSSISVLSIIGTKDGAVNKDTWESAKSNLPTSTTFKIINGGNHAQFGSYGFQRGDLPADISADEQLKITIDAIENWIISVPRS